MRLTYSISKIAGIALSMGLLSQTTFAATGSGSTASGSVLTPEQIQENARLERSTGFHQSFLKTRKAEADFRKVLQGFDVTFALARSSCRADIRRANRDTKFSVQMKCLRAELSLERDFLVRERAYIEGALGLTASGRDLALAANEKLVDAIETVLLAIESGVFETEADLREAKTNLRTLYRKTVWDTRILLRADRALTWIAYLFSRIDSAEKEEQARAGSIRTEWQDVRTCLTQSEDLFQKILESVPIKAADLKAAHEAAHVCQQKILAIPLLPNPET